VKGVKNSISFKKWPIIGHEKIIKGLQRSILNNTLFHAYLFSGLKGLGKRTTAFSFIKSIQCQAQLRPCGTCEDCEKIDRNVHPDVIFLEKEGSIKIDEIRDIQRRLSLTAVTNKYKICLIDNAENLTEEASNSLLKILEEPSGKIIFILITSDIRKILPTMTSRCLVINFLPVPYQVLFKTLSKFNLGRELVKRVVFLSRGRPGVALDYIKHPERLKERYNILKKFTEVITENDQFKKFKFLVPFVRNKEKGLWLLDLLLEWHRDLLMVKLNCSDLAVSLSVQEKNQKEKLSFGRLVNNINKIRKAKSFLFQNINPRLVLENLFIGL